MAMKRKAHQAALDDGLCSKRRSSDSRTPVAVVQEAAMNIQALSISDEGYHTAWEDNAKLDPNATHSAEAEVYFGQLKGVCGAPAGVDTVPEASTPAEAETTSTAHSEQANSATVTVQEASLVAARRASEVPRCPGCAQMSCCICYAPRVPPGYSTQWRAASNDRAEYVGPQDDKIRLAAEQFMQDLLDPLPGGRTRFRSVPEMGLFSSPCYRRRLP